MDLNGSISFSGTSILLSIGIILMLISEDYACLNSLIFSEIFEALIEEYLTL